MPTDLWYVCWAPLSVRQLFFCPVFFFFSPLFLFLQHWTILLASAKGNTTFLYTISSDPNISKAVTRSDYLQIYLPTRFPSPGQKRLAKGKGHQSSHKCFRTLSGCTSKGEQNHWAQRRLKSAAHTHTDTKEGGKREKKEKTKNIRKMTFFFFCFVGFVFKVRLWMWSITSCYVLNKVILYAI